MCVLYVCLWVLVLQINSMLCPFPNNGDALQHVACRPDGLHFRLLEKHGVSVLKSQVRTVKQSLRAKMSKIPIINPF